jgi:hypothetical protein
MNEKWKNEKSMLGGKVTDDSEDNTEQMKNENAYQTHMDQNQWS